MSGGIITVLLGLFERFSGKNVPLWVYATILVFFAFLACYLAWRDERQQLGQLTDKGAYKREFLAERLRTLLRDAEEAIKAENARSTGIIFMEAITGFLPIRNSRQIQLFLERYYDAETLQRFNAYGLPVIEELLVDCFREEKLTVTQKVLDR